MIIDVHITVALHVQVKKTVARDLIKHMLEKRHTRLEFASP